MRVLFVVFACFQGHAVFQIEATWNEMTQVQWRNELVDKNGNFLPHLLPVDQTLNWANSPGGLVRRDTRGFDPTLYLGPASSPC